MPSPRPSRPEPAGGPRAAGEHAFPGPPAEHVVTETECVFACQDQYREHRKVYSACLWCGHRTCLPDGPCDLCRLIATQRLELRALAHSFRTASAVPDRQQPTGTYVFNAAFRLLAHGLDRLADA